MGEHPVVSVPHIAVIPTPGMGHLIPLTELARQLVLHHNFSVTFLIPTDGSPVTPQISLLNTLPTSINHVFLPPVSFDDLPEEDVLIETRISLTITRSLPALRDSLRELIDSTRLVALVVDLFGTDAVDVAKDFGIPPYMFFPTTAMVLSLLFHLPDLDQKFSCQYRDLPQPVKLPGCVPVQGRDLLDPIQDRKNEAYKWVLHHAKRYKTLTGIIVNTFTDLESGALKALKERELEYPPVYSVGPLTRSSPTKGEDGSSDSECLRWLDDQPSRSVLFVSFGSGGTLSQEQLIELAFGLEMSGQRFLWVIKSPHEKAANASYFSAQTIKNPLDFLPNGYIDRIRSRGVGLLVPSWAPQVQVLSHGSTGGFLTHCGWNSTLETIVQGVPMIAWPLFAEQRMNAILLADDLKAAVRINNDHGIVSREEVANTVKILMEGEEGQKLRNKMKDLKGDAVMALTQNGSSSRSLGEVAEIWKKNTKY